jgi:hypothetical protein
MNLNGLPIRGTNNYKGFVTIGTDVTEGLTTTLKAVGDGVGGYSPLQLSTTQVGITGPVQTGTGSLYNPLRIGYSNSTISVTNLDLFSVGATANSGSRYSTILRLGGGSDTAEHYIYGGEGSSTGLIFDRGNTKIAIIGGIFESRGAVNYYRSVNSAVSAFTDLQFDVRNTYYQFNAGTGMGLGITSGVAARLHVRGDGTNPIARFEASGGLRSLAIESSGDLIRYGTGDAGMYILNQSGSSSISGQAIGWQTALSSFAGHGFRIFNVYDQTYTSGTGGLLDIGALGGTFAAAAGSANFRPLSITYTINNSGAQSGTATGIFLNATETALNGMTHNLMDLQVGGASRFRVLNTGGIEANATSSIPIAKMAFINDPTNAVSVFSFTNTTGATTFGGSIFRLNGTDATFPAIKRNGAAIDFVTADGVANSYCGVNAGLFYGYTNTSNILRYKFGEISGGQGVSVRDGQFSVGFIDANQNSGLRFLALGSGVSYIDGWSDGTLKAANYRIVFGSRINNTGTQITNSTIQEDGSPCVFGFDVHDASAIVQINSTTRGFLPPRMDDTAVRAIPSPAEGLVVFNTTISHFCVYQGGAWVRMSHSPM